MPSAWPGGPHQVEDLPWLPPTPINDTPEAREVAALVARSRAAQAQIADYTQEQVDRLIRGMVWAVAKESTAEMIAQQTVDETQLGNYEGKFLKIFRKTRATLMDIIDDKSVGVIEEDRPRNLIKIAKPVGVIGALSPSTNPEATPVIKAICAVKGRNSIIVAPHPRAKITNRIICDLMRDALVKMGAPADLVIAIETPSVEKTNEVMRQCDRILATGGSPMVKAAYSSGTPALGVGVGNAVITVDDTADLDDAAEKIRISKTLDLAASCSSDNSVILLDAIYDDDAGQAGAVRAAMSSTPTKRPSCKRDLDRRPDQRQGRRAARRQRSPEWPASRSPKATSFFIVPETGFGPDFPFSGEKMTVTMALYRAKDIDEAIALTNSIQGYQGQGHSCGIYSTQRREHPEAGDGHQDQPGDGQPAAIGLELGQSVERHAPDLLARLRQLGRQRHQQQHHLARPGQHHLDIEAAGRRPRCSPATRRCSVTTSWNWSG